MWVSSCASTLSLLSNLGPSTHECISHLSVLFHWSLWLSLCQCHTVDFLFQGCVAILGLLHFHMNFRMNLFISAEKAIGIEFYLIFRLVQEVLAS
jgi:hypothetical protein